MPSTVTAVSYTHLDVYKRQVQLTTLTEPELPALLRRKLAEAVPGNFPVFVKPNAGLPRADGSGYDITPQLFALQMKMCIRDREKDVHLVGLSALMVSSMLFRVEIGRAHV